MKIRTDFVSNSSSCSFIIHKLSAFSKSIVGIIGHDVPWHMSSLDVILHGKKEFLQEAANDIDENIGNEHRQNEIYPSWQNDDEHELRCNFSEFLCIKPEILDKIDYIWVDADDCDQSEMLNISILYRLAKKLGLDPDASNSERDMLFEEGNTSSFGKLIAATFGK